MAETRGTMKGALIGGAIGAAAALLLAPKSGRELRADIRDRYASAQDRTKHMIAEAGGKARETAKQIGQAASGIADGTRAALTVAKEEVRSWKEDAASEMKDEAKENRQAN